MRHSQAWPTWKKKKTKTTSQAWPTKTMQTKTRFSGEQHGEQHEVPFQTQHARVLQTDETHETDEKISWFGDPRGRNEARRTRHKISGRKVSVSS